MKYKNIILASGSPRRKDLLSWAGVSFKVMLADIDETPRRHESPASMVKRLAREKAKKVASQVMSGNQKGVASYVIAADTTVVSPQGKILGKPTHYQEALKMLKDIQGKTHFVLTGYCILKVQGRAISAQKNRVIQTKVTMRKLTDEELKQYLKRGESMDKAGAYAAQGYGMVLIQKIEGSYTNAVGLPMDEVLGDLKTMARCKK